MKGVDEKKKNKYIMTNVQTKQKPDRINLKEKPTKDTNKNVKNKKQK